MLLDEIKSIKATTPKARKFGLTIGILLLVIAAWLFWKERPSFPYFACLGGVLALVGLILPILLKPVYQVWMSLAMVMGFIMTRVILMIIYFGVFTPIALAAKLLRKDLLGEKWDKKASTYWVKRPATPYDPKSAENMF